MRRVYVAGPISAADAGTVLRNIGQGIAAGRRLLAAGFSPFVPHLNYHFSLAQRFPNELYYEADNAWLDVAQCIVMLPGWDASVGACREMERAKRRRIPIYHSVAECIRKEGR